MTEKVSGVRKARDLVINAQTYFESHLDDRGYEISRHLLFNPGESANNSYEGNLPTFEGKSFVQIIDARVKERQQQLRDGKNPKKIVIVDLGFGDGTADFDMAKRWKEDVEVIAYGDTSLVPVTGGLKGEMMYHREKAQTLDGVTFVFGNIINAHRTLKKILGQDFRPDFILSSWAFDYISYPHYHILKHLYNLLVDNGFIFGDTFKLNYLTGDDGKTLEDKLKAKRGYKFNIQKGEGQLMCMAIQKTFPHLPQIKIPQSPPAKVA